VERGERPNPDPSPREGRANDGMGDISKEERGEWRVEREYHKLNVEQLTPLPIFYR